MLYFNWGMQAIYYLFTQKNKSRILQHRMVMKVPVILLIRNLLCFLVAINFW